MVSAVEQKRCPLYGCDGRWVRGQFVATGSYLRSALPAVSDRFLLKVFCNKGGYVSCQLLPIDKLLFIVNFLSMKINDHVTYNVSRHHNQQLIKRPTAGFDSHNNKGLDVCPTTLFQYGLQQASNSFESILHYEPIVLSRFACICLCYYYYSTIPIK